MAQIIKVKLTNPEILTWAREELGLTVPDVAARFKKDRAVIEAWEHGDDLPPPKPVQVKC
jgi:DNA-binding transcriptional regulator YiaG